MVKRALAYLIHSCFCKGMSNHGIHRADMFPMCIWPWMIFPQTSHWSWHHGQVGTLLHDSHPKWQSHLLDGGIINGRQWVPRNWDQFHWCMTTLELTVPVFEVTWGHMTGHPPHKRLSSHLCGTLQIQKPNDYSALNWLHHSTLHLNNTRKQETNYNTDQQITMRLIEI